VIKSLFRASGLDRRLYRRQFDSDVIEDFPRLLALADAGYFEVNDDYLCPTALGIEWSDALAPSLFSDDVRAKMNEFELR
jgi:oxygen-independent coproporphyrinogen III oxidase